VPQTFLTQAVILEQEVKDEAHLQEEEKNSEPSPSQEQKEMPAKVPPVDLSKLSGHSKTRKSPRLV